jgi:carbonic anhydrase/acetyltransferase-like protein (isoleucine patch superfamily)
MAVTLPARNDESIFQRLARLGEQRALFPNGIRGAGDVVGDFSARLAEFDCELQADLRRAYTSVKRNYLEAVDRKGGWYRIPWAESPEPFGSNIIRLVPEAGAGKIVVDFRGFHDPDTFGDWRACIVAVDKADKCRYSPLWNKGVMEMEVRPDDTRFWLTVAATPTALPANWSLYVGRHAYRYPYEVKLSGCRPGTPLNLPAVAGKRHPNGGGMVVSSAEVAPTAYVGPDAVVFDGAKVLDHAVIEDFAVVRGGVTVAGHAKVGGQAEVSGNVVIDGYTRVLHPVSVKDQKDAPHEVPLRPEQQKDDLRKLWANYAMDREETELLEDWFRYKSFPQGVFFVLNLNGHLYGRPAFVVDGDHRGFRFDGKTQYAEAAPHLADLGEITVDIGLKWEGGANQAVFDFGTSADNRLVLIPAGASGKLELAIAREGKIERIIADTALPKDKWAQCRVEIDGKKIALWIDGRKAAEKASGFRPADVYLPGAEKRNFIAAARDGAGHFKGCLDHLRVHYKVYGDFAKEPVPRRHAPQRISKEFIEDYRKEIGGAKELEALVNAKREPLVAYYQQTRGVMDQRIREIDDGSEAVAEARRKLQELEKKLEQQNKEQSAKSDKPSETIKQQTAALSRQIIEAKMAVDAAIQENGARHSPERSWLGNYSRAAFSGHYNYPYHRYIQKWASLQVGGGEEPQEDLNSLEEVYTAQDAAKWYTKCDWEWRMPWEQDHSIDKLPLVKKWLERARGK